MTLTRSLLFILSAVGGAALFLVLFHFGPSLSLSEASAFGASAPMIGVALAFPAIYLLWEQSEL